MTPLDFYETFGSGISRFNLILNLFSSPTTAKKITFRFDQAEGNHIKWRTLSNELIKWIVVKLKCNLEDLNSFLEMNVRLFRCYLGSRFWMDMWQSKSILRSEGNCHLLCMIMSIYLIYLRRMQWGLDKNWASSYGI